MKIMTSKQNDENQFNNIICTDHKSWPWWHWEKYLNQKSRYSRSADDKKEISPSNDRQLRFGRQRKKNRF